MEKYKATRKTKDLTGSRKREVKIDTGTEFRTASYWDGGSKTTYRVLNTITGEIKHPPSGDYPRYSGEYTLQPNEIMIETGTFCGKSSTPRFSCLPEETDKMLAYLGLN